MQIVIDVSELKGLSERVAGFGRQARFATAKTLTQMAVAGRRAVQDEMDARLDRPKPWTKRMVRYTPATPENLEATVFISDEASKAVSPAKALEHLVTGGNRAWKRFEMALQRAGMLGMNENAVPGRAAKLDPYGNMDRGQLIQVLAYMQAFGQQGYRANTTAQRRGKIARGTDTAFGFRYFYKRDRPGRGIYKSTRKVIGGGYIHWTMDPVLMFVRKGTYGLRLDMARVVGDVARANFQGTFESALAAALRSAR